MNKFLRKKINYSQTGVDYSVMDPLKKMAQQTGKQTSKNLLNLGFSEVEESRGQSAYVWEEADCFRALVLEGLGTKNLVADSMQKITGKTYYASIAQDAVAAVVNDLIVVGAVPQVVNAYFGSGGTGWFAGSAPQALIEGWAKACDLAEVAWGGGETPSLSGIINPDTVDLAGACIGIIKPKDRLVLGDKLTAGDVIILIESSGIHSNGLSLARTIADRLPAGYSTRLTDGSMYGEALLTPTYIYVRLVKALFEAGVDIHYMANITGHGWKKLMRADRDYTYLITRTPPIPHIFDFIQEHSEESDTDMYGTFNMGAGLAIYLPSDETEKAQDLIAKQGFKSWTAGIVRAGPKQIVIEPKNITFDNL